jgi:hypothetical protein
MPTVAQHPQYTYDQLHERACIVCGRTDGELLRDGHITVDGLPWAVVAHPEHKGKRS